MAVRVNPITVLLVDDEPMLRKMAKVMLQRRGFKVLDSGSGEDALALCREHENEIDIVVTDVVMDGMDGFALADSMRKAIANLPVLFISGYPTVFESELPFRCGFLRKPFQADELVASIVELVNKVHDGAP